MPSMIAYDHFNHWIIPSYYVNQGPKNFRAIQHVYMHHQWWLKYTQKSPDQTSCQHVLCLLTNMDYASINVGWLYILELWFKRKDSMIQWLKLPYVIIWRHKSSFLTFSNNKSFSPNIYTDIYCYCRNWL